MFGRNKGSVGGGQPASPPASAGSSQGSGAGSGGPFVVNKGYGIHASAAAVRAEIVRVVEPGKSSPTFVAVPILNGNCYEQLNPFFEYRAVDLDAASGTHFHFLDVGDPGKTPEVYRNILAPGARIELERAAAEFAANVPPGRVDNVRLREMRTLAKSWMITDEDIPCLVFLKRGSFAAVEIMTFPQEWYASEGARVAFGRALRVWLEGWAGDPKWPATAPELQQSIVSLGRLVSEAVTGMAAAQGGLEFRREGDSWRVTYDDVGKMVRHVVGMSHIRYLIDHPERTVAARDLQLSLLGEAVLEVTSGMPLVDKKGVQKIQEALARLNKERESAHAAGNLDKLDDVDARIQAIEEHLASGVGFAGRSREVGGDVERSRKSVSRAVDRAVDAIREAHPGAGRHLDNCIKRGTYLSYRPDRPMLWQG